MAGTINAGIGAGSTVQFSYSGTGAYQVITVGFAPQLIFASASTQAWAWNDSLSSGQAFSMSSTTGGGFTLFNVNGAGQHGSASSDGRGIGFFVGTSTVTNANGVTFNGIAVR